jgi:hypothetical protein
LAIGSGENLKWVPQYQDPFFSCQSQSFDEGLENGSGGKKEPPRITYFGIPSSEPVYEDEAFAAILEEG